MVGARKKRRMRMIAAGAVAMVVVVTIVGVVFSGNIVFFVPPAELVAKAKAGEIKPDQTLRLGGLVEKGSWKREGEKQAFNVSDGKAKVPVRYRGVLPDLFREGQGVVVEGSYKGGVFVAKTVLAKHDENYMPREVAEALKKNGTWKPTEDKSSK